MLVKTSAIVLHSFKFGDSSIIVDMFTESDGRVSFLTQLDNTKKAKFKKQFFQPLTILDIEGDIRKKGGLQKLKNVQLLYPYVSLPFDVKKLAISLFLAEFLCSALKNEQTNKPLFEYIIYGLRWLDQCKSVFSNFHLVFLMRLSRFIGFYPNLDDYTDGCWFDMRNACFTSQYPLHRDVLKPDEAKKLCLLMRMNYETMHLYTMSHNERNRCIEVILSYYRLHIPDFKDIKSLNVLRELFF